MKIYFATWLTDRSLGETATKMRAFNRLVSFFFLKSQQIENNSFEEYQKTGMFDPRKKK